jgi:DNA repair protein RecO (recombination protein O)
MLHTTKGVVLHYFKYSENSIITKIYTEKFGLQTYILKGLGGKKTKMQKAYLQPLSLVEMSVYQKENKSLQSLKSIKLDVPFQTIPFNIYKSSIAFFLAEVLGKLIKEEEANKELFDYIYHSIEFYDISDKITHNFHLLFLFQLTKYFGIFPQECLNKEAIFFDLNEGVFKVLKPQHVYFSQKEETEIIKQMLLFNFNDEDNFEITNVMRKNILATVLEYYSLHSYNLKHLKTREVLSEVFS